MDDRSLPLLERFLDNTSTTSSGTISGRSRELVNRYLRERLEILFHASGPEILGEDNKYPYASSSVLNFGVGNLAGKEVSSVNTFRLAACIRRAILRFEPRINTTGLRVYFANINGGHGTSLNFVIEGEVSYLQERFAFSLSSHWNTESGEVNIIPFYPGLVYG